MRRTLLLAACLCAGCAALATGTPYRCGGGKAFTARIGLGEALVRFEGEARELRLPKVETATGAKYSDGRTTLWTRGREAYIERGGQPTHFGCVAAQ